MDTQATIWTKVLKKGLITIPKPLREDLGIEEGELVRVKKSGQTLIVEPQETAKYELYSDVELDQMLKEDQLPKKLSQRAQSYWLDVK